MGLAFKAAGDLLSPGLGTLSFFLLGLCPDILQCLLWGGPSRTPFLAPQPLPRAPWTLETCRVSSKHTMGACRPAGSAGKPPDSPPWTLDSGTRGLLHAAVWLGSDSRTSLEGGQDGGQALGGMEHLPPTVCRGWSSWMNADIGNGWRACGDILGAWDGESTGSLIPSLGVLDGCLALYSSPDPI